MLSSYCFTLYYIYHITENKGKKYENNVNLIHPMEYFVRYDKVTTIYHTIGCCVILFSLHLVYFTKLQYKIFVLASFISSFHIILSHLHFSPQGRAQMMYKAGLKTLQDVAVCEPKTLMGAVRHLSYVSAVQIVNTAKVR